MTANGELWQVWTAMVFDMARQLTPAGPRQAVQLLFVQHVRAVVFPICCVLPNIAAIRKPCEQLTYLILCVSPLLPRALQGCVLLISLSHAIIGELLQNPQLSHTTQFIEQIDIVGVEDWRASVPGTYVSKSSLG